MSTEGGLGISVGGKRLRKKQDKGRGPRKKKPEVDQLNLRGGDRLVFSNITIILTIKVIKLKVN